MIALLWLAGCFYPDVEPSVYCSDVCVVNPYLWGEDDVASCTAGCIADPDVTQALLNCLWEDDQPSAATMGFRLALCEQLLGIEGAPDTDPPDDTDDTDAVAQGLTVQLTGDVPEGATVAVLRLFGNVELDPFVDEIVTTASWTGPMALEIPASPDGYDAFYYVHAVLDGAVVAGARQVPVYEDGWTMVEVDGPDDVHTYDPAAGVVLEAFPHADAFATAVTVPTAVMDAADRVSTRGPTEGSTPLGTRPYDEALAAATFTVSWSGEVDPARVVEVPTIGRAGAERIVAYTDDGDKIYEPGTDPVVGQSCLGDRAAFAAWFEPPTAAIDGWELTLLGRGTGWGLVTVDSYDMVRVASGEVALSATCP